MIEHSADREQLILKQLRQGDNSAVRLLYAEYSGTLAAVAARYIANNDDLKDVMQEAFIKIFSRLDTFEYRGRGSLEVWMKRITINEVLQFLRMQHKLPIDDHDGELPDLPDEEPATEALSYDVLLGLIRQLPPGYRTVLSLYVFEGKSHKEIADLLHIRPDTSASQYHKAKNLLAHLIKEYKRNER